MACSYDFWLDFFRGAGIIEVHDVAYACAFTENRIRPDMLLDLNREILGEMGVEATGDRFAIIRHAASVYAKLKLTGFRESEAVCNDVTCTTDESICDDNYEAREETVIESVVENSENKQLPEFLPTAELKKSFPTSIQDSEDTPAVTNLRSLSSDSDESSEEISESNSQGLRSIVHKVTKLSELVPIVEENLISSQPSSDSERKLKAPRRKKKRHRSRSKTKKKKKKKHHNRTLCTKKSPDISHHNRKRISLHTKLKSSNPVKESSQVGRNKTSSNKQETTSRKSDQSSQRKEHLPKTKKKLSQILPSKYDYNYSRSTSSKTVRQSTSKSNRVNESRRKSPHERNRTLVSHKNSSVSSKSFSTKSIERNVTSIRSEHFRSKTNKLSPKRQSDERKSCNKNLKTVSRSSTNPTSKLKDSKSRIRQEKTRDSHYIQNVTYLPVSSSSSSNIPDMFRTPPFSKPSSLSVPTSSVTSAKESTTFDGNSSFSPNPNPVGGSSNPNQSVKFTFKEFPIASNRYKHEKVKNFSQPMSIFSNSSEEIAAIGEIPMPYECHQYKHLRDMGSSIDEKLAKIAGESSYSSSSHQIESKDTNPFIQWIEQTPPNASSHYQRWVSKPVEFSGNVNTSHDWSRGSRHETRKGPRDFTVRLKSKSKSPEPTSSNRTEEPPPERVKRVFLYDPPNVKRQPSNYEKRRLCEIDREDFSYSYPIEHTESSCVDVPIVGDNVGYQMLTKMGWNKGRPLGTTQGIIEPIKFKVRKTRMGLGANVDTMIDHRAKKFVDFVFSGVIDPSNPHS